MGYLIDILIGAASRIVSGELSAHVEPLARWIINKGASRLPVEERDRFREEWLAHMNEMPSVLRKLWHAMGCRLAAIKLDNVLKRQRKPLTEIDGRSIEIMRKIRIICGDAGFEQVMKAAFDAVADLSGRPAGLDTIAAKLIEDYKRQSDEPWRRRLTRRLYWIMVVARAAKLLTLSRGDPAPSR